MQGTNAKKVATCVGQASVAAMAITLAQAEAAILALLAHPTMPAAAKAAGVSETSLWRWLQRDDFQKKYREAQTKVDGLWALCKVQALKHSTVSREI